MWSCGFFYIVLLMSQLTAFQYERSLSYFLKRDWGAENMRARAGRADVNDR